MTVAPFPPPFSPPPFSPPPSPRTSRRGLVWIALPVAAGLVVAADPLLSGVLPRGLWERLHLDGSPLRLIPVLLAAMLPALWLAGLLRQAGSFAGVALAALLVTSQLNGLGLGPLDLFDLALIGVASAWLLRLAPNPDRGVPVPPLLGVALGLMVLAIAHLPLAPPGQWPVILFAVARLVLLTWLVADLVRHERTMSLVLDALLAVALLSALIGIAQFALSYLGVVNFTLIQPASSAFKPTPLGFVMRASGLCITAQHYSSFLVYALPVALWRASVRPGLATVGITAVLLLGLGVSLNFGGIFAGALVVALFPFLRWPHMALHLALLAVGVAALGYFVGLWDLVWALSGGDAGVAKGIDQRRTLFELGLEQVLRSPFVGTGLRGFGDVDGNFWHRPVHNLFGQAAAELGVPGALLIGAAFVALLTEMTILWRRADPARRRAPACLLMALAAALLLAQSEPNLEQSNLWLILALAQAQALIARRASYGAATTR